MKIRKYPPIKKVCQQCNKIFYIYPYRKDTAKFCSKSCGCKYHSGSLHNHFKTGRIILKIGYIAIRINKKYIYEHRHIIETHIGRPLLKSESVHHINGIRSDNRIENLIIMKKQGHDSMETKNRWKNNRDSFTKKERCEKPNRKGKPCQRSKPCAYHPD